MQIQFLDATQTPASAILVRPVNQDAIPAELEPVLVEAARQSRFAGKPGQVFEGFVERAGKVLRVALVGLGGASASDRTGAVEKAGAGIVAKYLTAGEAALTIDLTGSGLTTQETTALLLGARLRAWRFDTYRTKLTDDKKPSLTRIDVIGASADVATGWAEEEAVAAGVEFTRELVTEPANVIYPESFVERVRARVADTGLAVRVLDESEMSALGMGSLLGVAQGSARPPRLLVLEWKGGEQNSKPVRGLSPSSARA
jgi:leucyl aminopeptidase